MRFEFSTASKIVFERGGIKKLPELCASFGNKTFAVIDANLSGSAAMEALLEGFKSKGMSLRTYTCEAGEPTVKSVDKAAASCRGAGAQAVIGIGGGSVMDTAKASAGMAANAGSVRDYLEGVGTGAKMAQNPLPYIAVPTTSGTGAEVTKNAVIMSGSEKFKKSFRDDRLLANIALLDPELTVTAPKSVTASSGMDAVCQLVESFTSKNANPFCDAMSLYNAPLAIKALKKAYDDGGDYEARETMALASLVSGMCLANAGLGAAHGIGAGLGAVLGTPHGVACGMLLPHVMRYNIRRGVTKYSIIYERLFNKTSADEEHGSLLLADEIEGLCAYLKLPLRLGSLGVTAAMAGELAEASMGSSMSKNPVDIPIDECRDFIISII